MGRNRFALKPNTLALNKLVLVGLLGVVLTFLGLFFFYPLGAIIHRGFTADGLLDTWSASPIWRTAWFTFWQALLSTLATLILAWPMAYILGRLKFKGQSLLAALLVVPFVLPTVVVASAILSVQDRLGLRGVLHHTTWAILIAHVFFNYALVARIVGGFWAQLDLRTEIAARVLGANRWKTFLTTTLPQLRPAIVSAAGLVFFFSFTSFGVILILGGPTKATLDTEIWRFGVQRIEFEVAAAITLLQILIVGVMAFLNTRIAPSIPNAAFGVDARTTPQNPKRNNGGSQRNKKEWWSLGLGLGSAVLLLFLPLAVMVWESFSPRGNSLRLSSYRALFESGGRVTAVFVKPTEAIWNSLSYGLVAMCLSVLLGLMAAYAIFNLKPKTSRLFLEPLFLIPLGVSSVALGFGFLIALDSPPLDLRTSWILIPLAHALIGMPFVMRPILSQLRTLDDRMRWSAMALGASKVKTFLEVDLPVISRAILTGAGFAFAISLGEFGAASFLARPDRPTIPITIFRLLSQPGELSYGQAMALSTILMLIVALAVVLIDRSIRINRIGSNSTSTVGADFI